MTTETTFIKGQRVRLNDTACSMFPRLKSREGVVASNPHKASSSISILMDGKKVADRWHKDYLEKTS